MALATKCPHCNTIFRVAHDQLKLRGGIVRCGACNEVFDGNAALVEQPAKVAMPAAPETPAAFDTPELPTPVSAPVSAPVFVPVPEPVPAPPAALAPPAPVPGSFDEKMAALDTRAADALQAHAEEPLQTLDLDLDLDVDDIESGAEAATAAVPFPVPPSAPAPALIPPPVPASPLAPLLEQRPISDAELAETLAAEVATHLASEPPQPPQPAAGTRLDQLNQMDTDLADIFADSFADHPDDSLAVGHDLAADLGDLSPASVDGRREPTFGEPLSEHLVASAIADGHHPRFNELEEEDEEALVQLSAAAQAQSSHRARQATDDPADAGEVAGEAADQVVNANAMAEADTASATEEPGFVRRDRRRRQWRKASRIGMGLGSVLLLAALLGQTVSTFRNTLAAQVPALKPALQTACVILGCRVELPSQIDYVTIEQGELQTLNETTFSFTTLLRNQSRTAQNWPHIELILDDAGDKAVLRRVFAPRDYLGPTADIARGFAPHTEQSVKLYFELAQLKASGYHIAVFYP